MTHLVPVFLMSMDSKKVMKVRDAITGIHVNLCVQTGSSVRGLWEIDMQ